MKYKNHYLITSTYTDTTVYFGSNEDEDWYVSQDGKILLHPYGKEFQRFIGPIGIEDLEVDFIVDYATGMLNLIILVLEDVQGCELTHKAIMDKYAENAKNFVFINDWDKEWFAALKEVVSHLAVKKIKTQ